MRHHRWATAAVAVGTLLFLSAASILVASEARQSQRSQSSAQTVQETAQATAQKTARVIRVADEVLGAEAERRIAPWSRRKKDALIAGDCSALIWPVPPAERPSIALGSNGTDKPSVHRSSTPRPDPQPSPTNNAACP